MLKEKMILCVALFTATFLFSCGCKDKPAVKNEQEENLEVDGFTAENLSELVFYESQKKNEEGNDNDPWQRLGFKDMNLGEDAQDSDYDYADEGDMQMDEGVEADEAESEEGQIPDADKDFVAQPLAYYLGYHVDFNPSKTDLTGFKKTEDDGVGVIDRLDDKGSRIDILIYDKKLYDDFVLKCTDQVMYEKVNDSTFLSKDSLSKGVNVYFGGSFNGGYQISLFN